jgi:hypothetical protein
MFTLEEIKMWFDILKEKEETPHRMWPKPKELFEQNPERALGYVMSYWYIKHQQEIDAWVNSQGNLEGVFYDELCVGPDLTECKTSLDRYARGERVKFYRFGMGGFYIFDRAKIQEAIDNNKELLQKHSIPTNVDGLVKNVATTRHDEEDVYNFIAGLFGDKRTRDQDPLVIHQRKTFFKNNPNATKEDWMKVFRKKKEENP